MAGKKAQYSLAAVAAILLAAGALILILPGVRSLAERKLELGLASLEARLEQATGLDFEFSPPLLVDSSLLRIGDILIMNPADPTRKAVSAESLELKLDLWSLLRKKPAEIIRKITIRNLECDIDLARDADIISRIGSILSSPGGSAFPEIVADVFSASLSLRDSGGSRYELSSGEIQVSTLSGAVDLISPEALFFFSDISIGASSLFVSASPDLSSADFRMKAALSSPGLRIKEQGVRGRYREGGIEVELEGVKGVKGKLRY
ncbi:MAG TPA: hypothetical protein VIO60_06025, partial [Rectinemataceae bacterium]